MGKLEDLQICAAELLEVRKSWTTIYESDVEKGEAAKRVKILMDGVISDLDDVLVYDEGESASGILMNRFETLVASLKYEIDALSLKIRNLLPGRDSVTADVTTIHNQLIQISHVLMLMHPGKKKNELNITTLEQAIHKSSGFIDRIARNESAADGFVKNIEKTDREARAFVDRMATNDRRATEFLDRFVSTSKSIEDELTATLQFRTRYAELEHKLSESITEQQRIQDNLNDLVKRYADAENGFNSALGKNNKIGLTQAFQGRVDDLATSKAYWGKALALVLSLMVISALEFTINKHALDLVTFGARLAITLPLIWGAWFSAKQYGYTSRLMEDYQFKVATAASFEGYKKEAAEIDQNLLKKLMDSTIDNFSNNPLRIYSIASDGSPIQELADSIAKLEPVMKLMKKDGK